MKRILLLGISICLFASSLNAANANNLHRIFTTTTNPFNYDLQLKILPSKNRDAELLICLHGMGSNSARTEVMRMNPVIPYHVVVFNFPDYDLRFHDMTKTTFGTIDEIAPALFVLKKCVIDGGADKVHLHGFSAGGGAVINVLAALNSSRHNESLIKFGIRDFEKKKILQAIQKGSVILEVPLKSFDEIVDFCGNREMGILAERARKNGMVPIENINELQNLSLNCFVCFAQPDRSLGNRDDAEFIKRLENINKNGQTIAIIERNSSHTSFHAGLWTAYKKFVNSRN